MDPLSKINKRSVLERHKGWSYKTYDYQLFDMWKDLYVALIDISHNQEDIIERYKQCVTKIIKPPNLQFINRKIESLLVDPTFVLINEKNNENEIKELWRYLVHVDEAQYSNNKRKVWHRIGQLLYRIILMHPRSKDEFNALRNIFRQNDFGGCTGIDQLCRWLVDKLLLKFPIYCTWEPATDLIYLSINNITNTSEILQIINKDSSVAWEMIGECIDDLSLVNDILTFVNCKEVWNDVLMVLPDRRSELRKMVDENFLLLSQPM